MFIDIALLLMVVALMARWIRRVSRECRSNDCAAARLKEFL
jgi:hypothetical protein